MSGPRRRALATGGYLALAWLAWPLQASAAQIVAVRIWPARDYTRVTIESDAKLAARHQLLAAPPRLVVDIDGLTLDGPLRELVGKVRADDPYIAQLRVGQPSPGIVRLVLDLKQEVLPQVFGLAPVAAYQHRLVFDLYPQRPADPLDLLLAELALAPPAAAATPGVATPGAAAPAASPAAASPAPAASTRDEAAFDELIARQSQAASRPVSTPTPPPAVAPAAAPSAPAAAPPPAAAPSAAGSTRPAAPPPRRADDVAERFSRLVIVAIDPGHGGEDPGAIGPAGTQEKDITLAIAQRLKQLVDATPGRRAVLTRDGDYFVPLAERVRRARRVQADLFVSIHADAFIEPRARGASVFALSDKGASSAQARWLADKENAADAVGGLNLQVADSGVLRTMLDMSTTRQIQDSLKLGGAVLGEIGGFARLHKRQVEQAGFAVLKAPDIPSILVETAFISNPDEEQLLRDAAHQEALARALLAGIERYFARNPPLARARRAT